MGGGGCMSQCSSYNAGWHKRDTITQPEWTDSSGTQWFKPSCNIDCVWMNNLAIYQH